MSESGRRAVLYARVSTRGQAEEGYSLRQQIEALQAWCEHEGYEVLEVVTDAGHSGTNLERPGLDRVRDLIASADVSVVVAQDADRITRTPIHRGFLDDEFERRGTRLLALDDWGDDSHEGQLLRFIKGWVSKGERLKMVERSRRGKLRKVREVKWCGVLDRPTGSPTRRTATGWW
jgi:site-specific DNA recombinase